MQCLPRLFKINNGMDDSTMIREGERPPTWKVAVFGEVLFDCFPDGDRLGGAPFNVAWHLQGFGLHPRFISRVGRDPLGSRIRRSMERHGMDTKGLQEDPERPTGRVNVRLDDRGGHTFEICRDQAYDHIDGRQASAYLGGPSDLVCFGTLALREAESRSAILGSVTAGRGIRFLDVNLRDGCWTRETLSAALQAATVAKLNDDELAEVAGVFDLDGDDRERAAALRSAFGLSAMCVTAAERGAFWSDPEQWLHVAAPHVTVVDTVGAGDGFSSVLILGLLSGWKPRATLERAAEFAAAICAMRGACPEDTGFYTPFVANWDLRGSRHV